MTSELLTTIEDQIGYISLNRPDAHNAICLSMWQQLPEVLNQLQKQVKVIVLSGQGTSFAAGADLLELEKLESYADSQKHWLAIRDCLEALWSFDLPTIAMVNGACIGGGCLLALACDLRYAASSAIFGIPVSKLGIVLDDSNIARLVNLVGPANAKELLYLGSTISSTKALSMGLINDISEPDELQTLVHEIARQISLNAVNSLSQGKKSVNRAVLSNPTMVQDEQLVIGSYLDPEFRQRIKAILTGRTQ